MAELWFCFDGPTPTRGGPAYELPLEVMIESLGVAQSNFLSDLWRAPRFNDADNLKQSDGHRHVVLRLSPDEAESMGWKPGYYYLPLAPSAVIDILGTPRDPFEG